MEKDVLVELNSDNDLFEVSFGDFDGTDDDWTPVLASFYFKSDALSWALSRFKKIEDEEKLFVILDHTQELEMLAFSLYELDGILELIHEEEGFVIKQNEDK
ncbi:hypothetical protein [Neobacillus cucumis]|uniref:Uncharacterized protein n=1 Tax=Neobacillus cucumis TaxID=1740721 RepID=A0A2N5HET3_9BACI|nr:hypothetical protein [Neobacillus cucumis]PLS04038.1 hypothetical protein CVD27_12835 [Neobacillus cucumis]